MKHIFKNRIVLGLICIILSLIICFGLTPMFNNALKSKVEIVRVIGEIKKGDEITAKMVTTEEVGGYNLPSNVIYRIEDVIGKYANTDFYKGDYILSTKLSPTPMLKNEYLSKLNGENRAISVTIKSFAAGLSGKLEKGDIISLIVGEVGEMRETILPPELQYIEIIAVTASNGEDHNVQEETKKGEERELASAITVLASKEQARLLAELEQTGKLHAALVFRGSSEMCERFLEEQRKTLEVLYPLEETETEVNPETNVQSDISVANQDMNTIISNDMDNGNQQ